MAYILAGFRKAIVLPGRGLDTLGRLGPMALPAGIVIGLLIQPLAALLRPWLTPCIVTMLVLALVRLAPDDVVARLRHPVRLTILMVWLMVVLPILAGLALIPIQATIDRIMPGLGADAITLGWMLYATAPPLLGAAGFALMVRADVSMTVIAIVLATMISPLTVAPLILLASGIDVPIAAGAFMGRLALIIGGSAVLAVIMRKGIGTDRLNRHADRVSGALVLAMIAFAVGVMDGVPDQIAAAPGVIAAVVGAALLVSLFLQALCLPLIRWLSGPVAVSVMLLAGYRNIGLQIAALGDAADTNVMLFFAASQVPIYGLPAALAPLYRYLVRQPGPTDLHRRNDKEKGVRN